MTLLTNLMGYGVAKEEPKPITPTAEQQKFLDFLRRAKGPVLSKEVGVFFNISPQSVRKKIQPYLDAGWVIRRECRSHGSQTVHYSLAPGQKEPPK